MNQEASDLTLFFGRFHPLVLHLPIGFLTMAFILEILSRFQKFRYARPAVGPVLFAGALSAVVAAALGFLLAMSGDYGEELLAVHRGAGIVVALAACGAAVLYRFSASSRILDKAYKLLMVLLMIALAVAGHYGGSLTHGSDYLTHYMPNTLRKIAGLPPKQNKDARKITDLNEARIYGDIIYPILDMRCVSCHNVRKRKGELTMDTREGLMKGGKNGPVFIPGNAAKSAMIERIRLPESDDHHMPPDGKTQLTDEQRQLLAWWIAEGAPFDKKIAEVQINDTVRTMLNALVNPDAGKTEVEKLLASNVTPADEKYLTKLKEKGIRVRPLATGSSWLQADVTSRSQEPADSILHAFRKISDQLTWVNLGGTGTTDDVLASVQGLKNITRLHLENTRVTDAGLKHLKELRYLEYLNLYGTDVTDAGLMQLRGLKNLKKLFLWETRVTPKGVAALQQAMPALEVNMGFEEITDSLQHAAQSQKAEEGVVKKREIAVVNK